MGHDSADSDKDPLSPTAAHWRKITGPDGQVVWADLNSEGSHQFRDADFLPIQGWQFINDDSTPNDQRCDSRRLKEMIVDPDTRKADRLAPDVLARRLGDDGVRKKLRRVVCRFRSELQRETIAARYGFVKELDDFRKAPETRLNGFVDRCCACVQALMANGELMFSTLEGISMWPDSTKPRRN